MELKMNYTDDQLKQLLAKMLPETISKHACGKYYWIGSANGFVLDTELLYICSYVEAGLTATETQLYTKELNKLYGQGIHPAFSTWQQRTRALAEVKGVTL